MSCPECATRMHVIHTQSRDSITHRWYRCPDCAHKLRTREELFIAPPRLHPNGEDHPNAVLTNDNIRDLRAAWVNGAKGTDLATEYGIHKSTVSTIVHAHTWKHVA